MGGVGDWFSGRSVLPARQEVANGAWHLFGRRVADRLILDPHYRSERAAAEAGDAFNSEPPLGIGVRALGNAQVAAQRVLDPLGPAHVAGRAVANMDNVFAARRMPEHVVEGRDPANRCRRDLRSRANALQRLLRQVAVMVLQRLKDRDDPIGRAADALPRLIHVFQVEAHGFPFTVPRHHTFVTPRRKILSCANAGLAWKPSSISVWSSSLNCRAASTTTAVPFWLNR